MGKLSHSNWALLFLELAVLFWATVAPDGNTKHLLMSRFTSSWWLINYSRSNESRIKEAG